MFDLFKHKDRFYTKRTYTTENSFSRHGSAVYISRFIQNKYLEDSNIDLNTKWEYFDQEKNHFRPTTVSLADYLYFYTHNIIVPLLILENPSIFKKTDDELLWRIKNNQFGVIAANYDLTFFNVNEDRVRKFKNKKNCTIKPKTIFTEIILESLYWGYSNAREIKEAKRFNKKLVAKATRRDGKKIIQEQLADLSLQGLKFPLRLEHGATYSDQAYLDV